MPTLQLKTDREKEALRLKAQDDDEADGIALGTSAVDNAKGSRVQIDLRSGRGVTEVEWAALLDGSRVLELLYRLEVHLFGVAELVWLLELPITAVSTKRICSSELFVENLPLLQDNSRKVCTIRKIVLR